MGFQFLTCFYLDSFNCLKNKKIMYIGHIEERHRFYESTFEKIEIMPF